MPHRPEPPSQEDNRLAAPDAAATPSSGIAAGRRRLLVGGFAAGPVLYAAATRSALANNLASPSAVFSGNVSSPGYSSLYTAGLPPSFWKQNLGKWGNTGAPIIQLPSGSGWADTGTGNEPLQSFTANPPLARIKPTGPGCNQPPYAFGASFKSIFGNDGDLHPVVPTQSGGTLPNCNDNLSLTLDPQRPVSLWEVLAFPNEVGPTPLDTIPLGVFAQYCAAAYLNALQFNTYPVRPAQVKMMYLDGRNSAGFCPQGSCTNPWYARSIVAYFQTTWI